MTLTPPWRDKLKSRHQQQEEGLQVTHPASGRLWRWKRDGRFFDFLIEARTTDSGSYSISAKEWRSIKRDALQTPPGCMPAMDIQIEDVSLIAIEKTVFEEIFNELVNLQALAGREQ
jgi:hypothetical protein